MQRPDSAHATAPESSSLAARVAVVAAVALFLPLLWPLARGRVFAGDDLGQFHLPMRHFYARALARGDDPRWHPGVYCGLYLHGEGQVGMAHPAHALLYRVLPLAAAFQVELAIGYPLAFAGMVLWLRRAGLRTDAAAYGALVFAASTFFLLRYVHMNAVEVVAHLPWLLFGIECLARPRGPREAAWAGLGIALLTASQGLLGYPQYVGFSLMAEGLYALARFGRSWRPWARFALVKGMGGLAAGAQLLPHADALAGSWRAKPTTEFLGICSLHPLNLLQIVSPTLFRRGHYLPEGVAAWPWHESVAYLGAAVPTACAWLWIRRKGLGPWRPLAIGAAILTAFALVLAMGKYTPVFSLYARLPVARLFRAPSRYAVVAQLGASVLAAIAFADLSSVIARRQILPRRSLRPLLFPLAIGLVGGLLLVAFAATHPAWLKTSQVGSARDVLAGAAILALPAIAVTRGARGARWAPVALILLAAADSALFALVPILRHERTLDPTIASPGTSPPPMPGEWRRLAGPNNDAWASDGRLVRGYVALTPRRALDYRKPEVRSLAGVAWERDEPGEPWRSAALPPRPRAWLVPRAVTSRRPASDLATIDPATAALVEAPIALPAGPAGSASVESDRPGRIGLATRAEARRLLVLTEAHHPGWRAAIDGREAPALRVDGDFLGCVVPPGRHAVEFRFDPPSDRVGRWISALGLALIASVLAVDLRRARRAESAQTSRLSGRGPRTLTSARECDEMRGPAA